MWKKFIHWLGHGWEAPMLYVGSLDCPHCREELGPERLARL